MAFTNTQMRSASFGIVTSLPDDVIDSFWYIIDHFLKNVFELEEELEFQLLNLFMTLVLFSMRMLTKIMHKEELEEREVLLPHGLTERRSTRKRK